MEENNKDLEQEKKSEKEIEIGKNIKIKVIKEVNNKDGENGEANKDEKDNGEDPGINVNSPMFKIIGFYLKHFNITFPIMLFLQAGMITLIVLSSIYKWWWVLGVSITIAVIILPIIFASIKISTEIGKFKKVKKIIRKEFKRWHRTHPDLDIEYWKTYVLPSIAEELGLVRAMPNEESN